MTMQTEESHRCAPYWHMDCLATIAILALAFNRRQRRRLLGRIDLSEAIDDDGNPVAVYQKLHESCHAHEPLVKAIAKDLNDRFREMVKRVNASEPDEVRAMETDFPLPLLWATLSDCREEVRLDGRRRVHDLLLQALRLTQKPPETVSGSEIAAEALSRENRALKAKVDALDQELKQARQHILALARAAPPAHRPPLQGRTDTSRDIGPMEREIRKLSHALSKERERAAWLEAELMDTRNRGSDPLPAGKASPPSCGLTGNAMEDGSEPPIAPQSSRRGTIVCKGDVLCPERSECTCECPLKDLTVAILGGSEGAHPAYRCMVGELGGECLYHNGCLRQGAERLKRIIGQADIVVCITSLNSHAAVHYAKSICKRSGKRLLVTREAGIHSLREMLQRTAP